MQKVAGVSSVRVSLNEGLTVLDLKPGNTVTLARLREVIRNNGFVTREAQVVAVGSVVSSASVPTFEVSGTRERLLVTGAVDMTDQNAMKMTVSAVQKR